MKIEMTRRKSLFVFLCAGMLLTFLPDYWDSCDQAFNRKDFKTAYQLCRPLAEKGDASAQFHLGVMYQQGKGAPKNNTESYKWLSLSANQGNETASDSLTPLARVMTREQLAEAQKSARAWQENFDREAALGEKITF